MPQKLNYVHIFFETISDKTFHFHPFFVPLPQKEQNLSKIWLPYLKLSSGSV